MTRYLILLYLDDQPSVVYCHSNEDQCEELYKQWKPGFEKLGVNVSMLTGETSPDLKSLAKKGIVIATVERYYSL